MSGTEYVTTTRGVRVEVTPRYLDDQSDPDQAHYVWAYQVRISNQRQGSVQLLRRSWHIVDGRGQRIDVEGAGVVGEQPVLEPGETFEYTSGTPLGTPTGFMSGSYQMSDRGSGELFLVDIPAFSLDSPDGTGVLH